MDRSLDDADSPPAAKKLKVSDESQFGSGRVVDGSLGQPCKAETRMTESRAGITQYMDASIPGFEGTIKQRFTDFMVNEIDTSGQVCRIASLNPPPGKYLDEVLGKPPAPAPAASAPKPDKTQACLWPIEADEKLAVFFADEAIASLRDMWTSGMRPESKGTGANATLVSGNKIITCPLASKAERTEVHKLVRELFSGILATDTCTLRRASVDDEDARANGASIIDETAITVRWANRSDRRAGDDLPVEALNSPPYIHFLLQKTNRDHQEAMQMLAQSLGLGGGGSWRGGGRGGRSGGKGGAGGRSTTKDLSVAGTKDKRAVTVQRVSLKRNRKTLDDVWRLVNGVRAGGAKGDAAKGQSYKGKSALDAVFSRGDRGIRIAHLSYADHGLKLGQLKGNEFTITLRNVKLAGELTAQEQHSTIARSMQVIQDRGFINYYGMQRFGTGSIPTHHLGILIFNNDFKSAIDLLFTPRPPSSPSSDDGDNPDLLKAKSLYHDGQFDKAYYALPKNCIAEKHILDKMRRPNFNKGDWAGAFGNIPRTLRLMYVHAYQSYVWNQLVSERLCKLGSSGPVEGDMVFVGEAIDGDIGGGIDDVEVDGSDDDQGGDRSGGIDLSVPRWQQAIKVLSAEDVQTAGDGTSRWTIYDVVLPLPGLDIEPVTGWMAELYGQILSGDGLTHADLTASKIPEYQLKGSYRHMIVKPKHFRYSISTYSDPDVALTKTDEEICLEASQDSSQTQAPVALNDTISEAPTTTKPFTALTLHFQLPSSSYATMLMREALKRDTSSFKHRQMTQQSEDQQFKGTSIPL